MSIEGPQRFPGAEHDPRQHSLPLERFETQDIRADQLEAGMVYPAGEHEDWVVSSIHPTDYKLGESGCTVSFTNGEAIFVPNSDPTVKIKVLVPEQNHTDSNGTST